MRWLLFFLTAFVSLNAQQSAVKTPEDHQRLAFFQSLKASGQPKAEIPKVLHIVWLETRALPKKVLDSWTLQHKDWQVKVWSEEETFPLGELEACYYDSESKEERSLIVRYAILLSEGGVAVHPDLKCIASLEPLRSTHDFFCALAIPGHTFQSSSVQPACELIAAAPGHPILARAKEWMIAQWKPFEEFLPGTDYLSVQSRIQHRCAHALSVGIEQEAYTEGLCNSVFAPHYFYGDEKSAVYATAPKALFGRQQQAEKEKMEGALKGIHNQLRLCLLLIFVLGALNLILAAVIVYLYRKRKDR